LNSIVEEEPHPLDLILSPKSVEKSEDYKTFLKRKQTILINVEKMLQIKFPDDE